MHRNARAGRRCIGRARARGTHARARTDPRNAGRCGDGPEHEDERVGPVVMSVEPLLRGLQEDSPLETGVCELELRQVGGRRGRAGTRQDDVALHAVQPGAAPDEHGEVLRHALLQARGELCWIDHQDERPVARRRHAHHERVVGVDRPLLAEADHVRGKRAAGKHPQRDAGRNAEAGQLAAVRAHQRHRARAGEVHQELPRAAEPLLVHCAARARRQLCSGGAAAVERCRQHGAEQFLLLHDVGALGGALGGLAVRPEDGSDAEAGGTRDSGDECAEPAARSRSHRARHQRQRGARNQQDERDRRPDAEQGVDARIVQERLRRTCQQDGRQSDHQTARDPCHRPSPAVPRQVRCSRRLGSRCAHALTTSRSARRRLSSESMNGPTPPSSTFCGFITS